MKFYICRKCGSILTDFNHVCAGLTCCGETVEELVAGTTDGAREKHVPAVTVDGQKVSVQVGEVEHPMLEKWNSRLRKVISAMRISRFLESS